MPFTQKLLLRCSVRSHTFSAGLLFSMYGTEVWPISHIRHAARDLCHSLFHASNLQMTLYLVICSRLCSVCLETLLAKRRVFLLLTHIKNKYLTKGSSALTSSTYLENFQLHMVIPTGKQAFGEPEGTPWKSCTASTLFPVPSVFHNGIELTP